MGDDLVCGICGELAGSARAAYLHKVNADSQYEKVDPSEHRRPKDRREKVVARDEAAAKQQAQIVCPHCQTKGSVTTSNVNVKRGISGGKATGALLTGGLSLFATGLSRKQRATQANCRNCGMTWVIGD